MASPRVRPPHKKSVPLLPQRARAASSEEKKKTDRSLCRLDALARPPLKEKKRILRRTTPTSHAARLHRSSLSSHPLLLPHPPHPRSPQYTRVDGDWQPLSSLTLPLTTWRDGKQRRRIALIGGRRARRQEEEGEPLGSEAEAEQARDAATGSFYPRGKWDLGEISLRWRPSTPDLSLLICEAKGELDAIPMVRRPLVVYWCSRTAAAGVLGDLQSHQG